MERILITGVEGFLGSALRKKLEHDGYYVDGCDKNLAILKTEQDVATFNFLWNNTVLTNKRYDYIYHLGSPCSILQFNKNPEYCVQNTLDGFRNILRIAKFHDAKLIYPSSGNVYGSLVAPHHERLTPHPTNLYGVCKVQCEQMALDYNVHEGVDSTGLRIFTAYGQGEEQKGPLSSVLCQFLQTMLDGHSPIIWGDGKQVRDFIYVDDVVDALVNSMKVNASIINVGSGTGCNYIELIRGINRVLGTEIEPIFESKPSNYVDNAVADTMLMKSLLRIKPRSLNEGIRNFVQYLRKPEAFK